MTPALQMPYREQPADQVGPRLFRKQILKVGEIPYKGKRLKFDRDYLAKAVDSFNAGAYDQVPFVLADDENRHATSPERFRGEVKALELNGDGIDALVELTEEGAEIVRKNPRLGVSARLVPDRESNGQVFPVAIEHVCGTLNPRVNGLRPWETDSVRSLSQTSDQTVIDLSASDYMDTTTLTDEQLDSLKGLQPDERATKARELLGEMTSDSTVDDKAKKFSLKGLLGIKDEKISDDDIEDALSKLESEDETTDDREPVAASLSDDDKRRIDLAEETARKADERVAAAEWKTERSERAQKGCPPAMLDLAEPVLKSGQKVVIDLSDDQKADASEVIRKLLDAAEGTVDLSDAQGSSEDTEGKYTDKDWEASV
jgi:hypothetical protein